MALINDVKTILNRLAGHGWREMLLQHDNFDITASDLASELARGLIVNRKLPGFEDFSPDGKRGIEPGNPAQSLLYHALASPIVHPLGIGGNPSPSHYPTLAELDIIENYIFATAKRQLSDFPEAIVAVFAYQYRTAGRSPHGLFADMAYSRAGVARVGTARDHYDATRRSFWVEPEDGGDAIAVLPARYAAFLAVARTPRPGDVILQDEDVDDSNRTFLFPVHKLFQGPECLSGSNLKITFSEQHRNEKLQRLHTEGEFKVIAGFNINEPPFIRESSTSGDLVSLRQEGASVLVVPKGSVPLVRPAKQRNTKTKRDEFVRFVVPKETNENRFWTSFQTANQVDEFHRIGRAAPGYVNIRHLVKTEANGTQTIEDLNQSLIKDKDFLNFIKNGGYEAAHFIDDTCDGCIAVAVNGLTKKLKTRPAYSLVTAPDFFPLVDQLAVADWVKHKLGSKREQFSQGEPWPLSDGRHPANPTLKLPGGSDLAFSRDDDTIMAVVATLPVATARPGQIPDPEDVSISFLPDGASNEFEPGWDVTLAQDDAGQFYTTYGLGSPFPEDSKLCAALNSFWPAVAPDATRTFGLFGSPTAIPMLDGELGYHPNHPRVQSGEVVSRPGWDGEFGPFLENHQGVVIVNCANKDRSDYISNAESGLLRVSGLSGVTSAELIGRMEALRACIVNALPATDPKRFVSTTKYFLVSVEGVDDWAVRPDRGNPGLVGKGYLMVFVLPDRNSADQATEDPRRRRFTILPNSIFTAQVTATGVCWRQGADVFKFIKLP